MNKNQTEKYRKNMKNMGKINDNKSTKKILEVARTKTNEVLIQHNEILTVSKRQAAYKHYEL